MKGTERIFRTTVDVGHPLRPIGVGDKNVFLGSCFAENVGRHFVDARLHALVNPMGVLYNPVIISDLIYHHLPITGRQFVQNNGMWHTWLGDTSLSRLTREECERVTRDAVATLQKAVVEADNLFLTLGTSRSYILEDENNTVANCHRMPPEMFWTMDVGPDDMEEFLGESLDDLHERNPHLQVIFTISPFRYAKYGMHGSQLDKARLLLGVEELMRERKDWTCYFPAYEIVMDELRDYRFYADDMLHPSPQAVDYIWQRLQDDWMTDELRQYLSRWAPLGRALAHRPLHPESPEYTTFCQQTRQQLAQLQADYPMLNIEN